uniref:Putative beta-glucosidase n=1 Tax=uncultured bacterium fosmid pJB69A5 TaxID=1478067 RepID=A0A0H3U7X4_9BACT|nr:putative beta-glucosidase [uncultured bacterium fosmid pJB69A5]
MKKSVLLFATMIAAAIAANAQVKLSENNIDEVVKAMTLEEKASILVGGGWGSMMAGLGVPTGNLQNEVDGAAGITNPIDRLGIPGTIVADGPAGLRIAPTRQGDKNTYYCTAFPVGTVLACTWDTQLVENLLKAMGNEVHEYGVDVLLAPGQNIHRNPLCGRNFEYFSEDPILSGKISAAYIRGVQSQGVGVSAKHFAGNDQEINRQENDARISQRALREIYLRNFEIAVKEAQPWTLMSSYNKINGTYTQQSYDLLTTILRDEWGFNGIVMTDWGAKAGTVAAVHAQNDLMEAGSDKEKQRIIDGVNNGTLDIADVDRNVTNMLRYIVKTPHFKGYKYSNKPDLTAHAKQVREAGAQGMVLLKNSANTLPMKGIQKVALFGPQAYATVSGGTGSGSVNKKYMVNINEGLEAAGLTLDPAIVNFYKQVAAKEAAEKALGGGAQGGFDLMNSSITIEPGMSRAALKASVTRNDAAIIVIGRNAGEGDDRRLSDFNLSAAERALINDACDVYHEAGKKVIVVMNIGGVIETASWKAQPDAILCGWAAGQEMGHSVADVLTGKVNPSGKLSMTFPNNYFDIPSSRNFPYRGHEKAQSIDPGMEDLAEIMGFQIPSSEGMKDTDYTNYEEGIYVGYRYFNSADVEVSYPFGYGLSYTTFAYSKPSVKATSDGGIQVSVTVKNTGSVAGKEAVQVYVSAPAGGLEKPASELKAFAKTRELQPGESQTLTMTCSGYYLASFNEGNSCFEKAAGQYTVMIGASIEDIRAKANVSLKAQSWQMHNAMPLQRPLNELSLKE